jgi:hypothetical protein
MSRTPKAAMTAMFPPAPRLAGVTLPPISILTYLALEAIDSPLVVGGAPGQKVAVSIADMATAIALVRTDPVALSELVARYLLRGAEGAEAAGEIRAMAMQTAAEIPVGQLRPLIDALRAQIERGFTTAVAMADPESPAPPLARRTGSKASPAGAGRSS